MGQRWKARVNAPEYWNIEEPRTTIIQNIVVREFPQHQKLQIATKQRKLEVGVKNITVMHLDTMSREEIVFLRQTINVAIATVLKDRFGEGE